MEDLMRLIGGGDEEHHRPFNDVFDDQEADFGVLHPIYGYSVPTIGRYGVEDLFYEPNRISMLQSGCTSKGTDQDSIYKYSLRIKSCGGGMADDGYKWRKYGQKTIKNSPNPRSYYRCTNHRCSAKKQVERSMDDPETYVVTYEGLHLHFTFPFFAHEIQAQVEAQVEAHAQPIKKQKWQVSPSPLSGPMGELADQQGLLEDVVPLMVRKPMANVGVFSNVMLSPSASDESCTASPASSDSFSWSSTYSYLGLM